MPVGSDEHGVTRLLASAGGDDGCAAGELLDLIYAELRDMAGARMAREAGGHMLQPTALVHEAYIRLVGGNGTQWQNRRHFFGAAAEAMRRILIEQARREACVKHGGAAKRADVDVAALPAVEKSEEILAVDEALSRMESIDPRMSKIVKLRVFAGFELQEIAQSLDISERTVRREWAYARACLADALRPAD